MNAFDEPPLHTRSPPSRVPTLGSPRVATRADACVDAFVQRRESGVLARMICLNDSITKELAEWLSMRYRVPMCVRERSRAAAAPGW